MVGEGVSGWVVVGGVVVRGGGGVLLVGCLFGVGFFFFPPPLSVGAGGCGGARPRPAYRGVRPGSIERKAGCYGAGHFSPACSGPAELAARRPGEKRPGHAFAAAGFSATGRPIFSVPLLDGGRRREQVWA